MHKVSLKMALAVMMVAVALLTLLLYNAVYGNMTGEAFSQLDLQLINQNLTRAKERLDEVVLGAEELSNYVVQSVLMQEGFSPGRFAAIVDPQLGMDGRISSVILYKRTGAPVCASSGQGGVFLSSQNSFAEPWFQAALDADGLTFSGARLEHCYRGQYTWVVTLARPCSYLDNGQPVNGLLCVNLRLSALKAICDTFSQTDSGTLTLTDTSGEVIYSPRTKVQNLKNISAVYSGVGIRAEEFKQLEISQPLANEQWILVGQVLQSEATHSRLAMQRKGILVLCAALLTAAVLAWALAEWMARPIRYMERTMEKTGSVFSGQHLDPHGCKEFVHLSQSYNSMIDKIQSLMAQTQQDQEQLRLMEIATLQEQINPHFLYNALDSITWLVETGRGPDAVRMIGALAKLLRLSINRGGTFHTVAQEVEHIHNYLIIQKTRYGQRFESHLHVEKEAESLFCPRLILQPIVENAIKHGIGDNTDCQIIVRVWLEDGQLCITVWDDGMGILPDRLREVQQALRESQPPRPDEINGLALKSVNRRIRLLCGEGYGLTIDSETEEWTCARITLPVRHSA